eukprot:jgi/Botrbrau1/15220/Bobra.0149s0075.1
MTSSSTQGNRTGQTTTSAAPTGVQVSPAAFRPPPGGAPQFFFMFWVCSESQHLHALPPLVGRLGVGSPGAKHPFLSALRLWRSHLSLKPYCNVGSVQRLTFLLGSLTDRLPER